MISNSIHISLPKPCVPLFLLLLFLACLTPLRPAEAKTVLVDGEGKLSTDEAAAIEESCDNIATHYGASIYIIFSKDMSKTDDYHKYMDDIGNDKDSPKDLVLALICSKGGETFCAVKAYGSITEQLTEARCESLAEDIANGIDDPYAALDSFTKSVTDYLGTNPVSDHLLFHPLLQLFLIIVIAAVFLYLFAIGTTKKLKFQTIDYADLKQSCHQGTLDILTKKEPE